MKYLTAHKTKWSALKQFGRDNRKNPTPAEKIVWLMVRKGQMGVQFRRQHAIAEYIADFVCLEKKLVIEIDGDSHTDREEYDSYRTEVFEAMGFRVIRFTNEEVFQNSDNVERCIKAALNEPDPGI